MGHVHATATIPGTVDEVFGYASDYRHMHEWVFGLDKIRPLNGQVNGVGALFEGAANLGPITLRATYRISEWVDGRSITFESVKGFDFTARSQITVSGPGLARIDVDGNYSLPGGIAGRTLGRTIDPLIAMALRASQESLKREFLQRFHS